MVRLKYRESAIVRGSLFDACMQLRRGGWWVVGGGKTQFAFLTASSALSFSFTFNLLYLPSYSFSHGIPSS